MRPYFLAVDEQTTTVSLLRGRIPDAMQHPDFCRELTVVAEPDLSEAWYFHNGGWRSFSTMGLTIAPEWYTCALQAYMHLQQDALRKALRLKHYYWALIAAVTALGGLAVFLILSGITLRH